MKHTRLIILSILAFTFTVLPARAAIQIGDVSKQASFAASTTQEISGVISSLVDTNGIMNSSWTTSQSGIWESVGGVLIDINIWLRDKAGVNFFAILEAIWKAFFAVIHFVIEIIRKLL